MDRPKDNAGEEEPNVIKPLFPLGFYVPFSSLSGKELLPFPTPGHILATLSSPFLWATPECLFCRVLTDLRDLGDLQQYSCWEGEAAVVPWRLHVVMLKMTACY